MDSGHYGAFDGTSNEAALDDDAVAIGELYARSNSSFVDAVQERGSIAT
jgi:hypothetical protein